MVDRVASPLRHVGTHSFATSTRVLQGGLPLLWKVVISLYAGAVILLSFQDGLPSLVTKGLAALLGAGFLFLAFGKNRGLCVPTSYRLWAVWFCIAVVSSIFALVPALAAVKLLTLIQLGIVGFILTNFLLWQRDTRFYWMSFIFFALVSGAVVWFDPARFADADGRVHGTIGDSNYHGTMLVIGFLMAVVGLLSERRLMRLVMAGAVVLLFVMVLQTGSRQALLGSFVGGMVIVASLLLRARKARRGAVWGRVAVVAVAVPVALFYTVSSSHWHRMEAAIAVVQTGSTVEADRSLVGRLWLYEKAFDAALERPLIGIGLDNFRQLEGRMIGTRIGTFSHSNYMEIMVGTGFIGFGVYFAVYVIWIMALYRQRHFMMHEVVFPRYVRVVTLVASFIVMDITLVYYYSKGMWLVYPWIIAEIEHLRRIQAALA